MLKQTLCFCAINLAAIALSPVAIALRVEEVPNPRQSGGWVTDMTNTLSPETEAQLNQMISDLEAKNGSEIAVVTVPETSPSATPKEFATTLFNYWHIGKADKNNGVLFLISTGDRRVEIETGYGIASILPDAQVRNIINQEITPKFKQGDFDGGTLVGTQKIITVLNTSQPYQTNEPSRAKAPSSSLKLDPIFEKNFLGLLIGSGLVLSVISCIGMHLISRKPALISPQANTRITGLERHDQPVYYLVLLWLFSTPFTAVLIVGMGVIGAFLAGGMNCLLFALWLKRSLIQTSTPPPPQNSNLVPIILVGCVISFFVLPFILGFGIMEIIIISFLPEYILPLLIGGILYFPISWIPKNLFDKNRITRSIRPLYCAKCQQQMSQLDSTSLLSILKPAESVAQKLSSVTFEGWECPRCRPKLIAKGINIRAYVLDSKHFIFCPNCQELTMTRQEIIVRYPTEYQQGKKLISKICRCCDYRQDTVKMIPRIRSYSTSSDSGSSSSSDTSYSSSSYDSGSSSSSSSSDSGGGSSGGGGDGGSW